MQKWIGLMISYRKAVIGLTLLVTVLLLTQLRGLEIVVDPETILPHDHHFVHTSDLVERTFGSKFTVVIAMTPKSGDIYQTDFLKQVKEVTNRLAQSEGAIQTHINGIASPNAKRVDLGPMGPIAEPLLDRIPSTPEEMAEFKAALHSDPSFVELLYSKDEHTTQILAEFAKIEGGFTAIEGSVRDAVAPALKDGIQVQIGGLPIFLAALENFSERMAYLFPLALLVIGLIHYEAFRTKQALILPLVTALLAVVWAVGGLGLMRQSFDVFNATTPILILAIAAGHAVQILKRYYEEFHRIKSERPILSAQEINFAAVEAALIKVGPVMAVACVVAALGFFSLVIFDLKTIRTFGLFTGFGILSALIIELTFIPALRALLPPPGEIERSRERKKAIWDVIIHGFSRLAFERRKMIYIISSLLFVIFCFGGYLVKVDNSQKGYFLDSLQVKKDDAAINGKLAGTNVIYVLIDGKKDNSISDLSTITSIERMQQFLDTQPFVGKTISVNNYIKRVNQVLNGNDLASYAIPNNRKILDQFFGQLTAIDSWVDAKRDKAVIAAFIKTDSSAYIESLARAVGRFAKTAFADGIHVDIGGGALNGVALNEVMIREKILNIGQILLAVFLISSLVFRSLGAGLFILSPLVAAVIVNFGIMGIFSIPLQVATALVSSIAVGIGADYSIYMSYRMREELRKQNSEHEALKAAFLSAGKATLFVASAVAGGFGILMLSWGFLIHIWMGFLIATAMLTSAIAALTLFPALVMTFRPRFIFEARK